MLNLAGVSLVVISVSHQQLSGGCDLGVLGGDLGVDPSVFVEQLEKFGCNSIIPILELRRVR